MDEKVIATLVDGSGKEGYSNTRIFGRRLRKFSLWHKFLLRAIQSPFITKKPVRLSDLERAIGICSLEYPSSDVRRPWLMPQIFLMGMLIKSLFSRRKPQKGEDNLVQSETRKHIDKFLAYTADYLQEPEYAVIPPDTNGKFTKPQEPRGLAEDELEHLADLLPFTRWDDKKIWNLPIGYANWLRVFAVRAKGADVSFTTAAEKEWQKTLPEEYRWKK